MYASEPERGVTQYAYAYSGTAGLGLKVTRTRPQANQTSASALTTTTTQYDVLGRVVSVAYSDGLTGGVTATYDAQSPTSIAQTNVLGRLAGVVRLAPGTSTTIAGMAPSYDPMGRVSLMAQCTPSGCGNLADDKHFAYTYDWLGNLVTSTDGNDVMTTYTYTPANEVQSITSSANDATHPPNLVSSVKNGPFGPISYALGNGLSAYISYDTLGRLNGKWICNGPTPAQNCSGSSVAYSFTTNWRGQRLLSSTDSVVGSGAYNYDDFNRLALTNYNNGANKFSEVYDRYGNRWQQNMLAGEGAEPQLTFNASNQMVGYSYDAAGNVANDGYHSYAYDAEGQVLQIDNGSTETYTHDALGHLVRADIPPRSASIEFYFHPWGKIASTWNPATGAHYEGEYYWGSTDIALYADNATHFLHPDWLGTARVDTAYNGGVEATISSLPFGDDYAASGPDYNYYDFAGTEFDSVVQTDFGQFRQYSPKQGRWYSPDPYDGSYDFANPQTFNRYAYALDNPLAFTDPTGMDCDDNNGTYTGATTSGDPTSGFTTTFGVSGGCNGVLVWYCGEYGGCGPDGQNPQPPQTHPPSSFLGQAKALAQCASNKANSLSLAALLPQGAPTFLQNALGNDLSTISNLVTGPGRGAALIGIVQGKLTSTGLTAIGNIPTGSSLYFIEGEGAAQNTIEFTPTIATSLIGREAAELITGVAEAKLAYDGATYIYGALSCSGVVP